MPIATGFRVSELVAAGDLANPADIGPNDVALFWDAEDTGGLHAGPSGNLKPLRVSGIPTVLGLGTAAFKATGSAADRVLLTDANADLALASGAWSSSGANTGVLVGGNIKQATLFHVNHTYTADQNPLPKTSGGQLGVGFLYDGTIDLNYNDGTSTIGSKQPTGFFGPRGVFSNELTQVVHQNQKAYGFGPIGFTDMMMVKNVPNATAQMTVGPIVLSDRITVADGGAVTLHKTDAGLGISAFQDTTHVITAGTGTIDATEGGDWTMYGFRSTPAIFGRVTMSRRVAFHAGDFGWYLRAGILDGVDGVGGRVTNTLDGSYPTVGTNIGLLVDRFNNGTTKIGILNNSETWLWNDDPTISTGGPTHVQRIGAGSTWTLGTGSDGVGTRIIEIDPTIEVDTTINALFGEFRPFVNSITLQSAHNATARNLQDMQGFRDSPLIQGNQTADAMYMVHSFVSAPAFSAINNGSLLLDLYQGFYAVGRLVNNATITDRRGLMVDDIEKGGTNSFCTNQWGVDIARFVNATTTNVGIRCNSPVKLWEDIVTFNTNPDDVISVPGTYTLGTGSTLPMRALHMSSTLVVDTTLNAFASRSLIYNDSTYKSATNATARDLKDMRSFADAPAIKADTSSDTMSGFASFSSSPAFSKIGASAALAVTNIQQFWAIGPSLGTGVTVTNRRGLWVQDATGASLLLANNYGVDIDRMAKGTTKNVGIRSNSPVVLWDDTVTFTTLQDNILSVLGTFTFSSGATFTTRALSVKDTLVINTTLDALATPSVVQSDRIIKSFPNTTARDFKSPRTFSDTSTVQGDTSADTMAAFASFHSAPIFGILNSGQLAITEVNQLYAAASAVGQGVTVTTHRGLRVENPTLSGNGAVVTAIGLDVADITAGGTKNRAIRVGSGGIEIAAVNAANELTATLPTSAFVVYTKGTKLVFAMNISGVVRYVSLDFSGNGNAFTTTSQSVLP